MWNPFRSKLAAAILGGVDDIWIVSLSPESCQIMSFKVVFSVLRITHILFMLNFFQKPGARVLYLGAASGTTVSHVSDLVGPVSIFVCESDHI